MVIGGKKNLPVIDPINKLLPLLKTIFSFTKKTKHTQSRFKNQPLTKSTTTKQQ